MRFAWLLQPHKINDKIWGVRKDRNEGCVGSFIVYFISPTKRFYFAKSGDIQGAVAVVLVAGAAVVVAVLVERQEFVSVLSYWAAS